MKILRSQKLLGLCCSVLLLAGCGSSGGESATQTPPDSSPSDGTLTIWWAKSLYIQEDEALEAAIAKWQEKTGNSAELIFVPQDDLSKNLTNALNAGTLPDLVFSPRIDATSTPRWAWQGQLADVSSVVAPLKDKYTPAALKAVSLYNKGTNKRSIYTVPIKQQTIYVHYWRDLLTEAGLNEADIPQEWDAFWDFWRQAQDNLRAKGNEDVYCCGLPLSSEATDTHFLFEQILEAYDVSIVDADGNLLLDRPEVRSQIIKALEFLVDFDREGYVPADADNWTDGSNNKSFLEQQTVMTINPTLSIPGSQREDEEIYRDRMVTTGFPREPDGEKMRYIVTIKQVAVFATSPNQEIAKDFLSYLIQPEHLGPYLENSFGRYFPVMPELTAKPFWNDPADPHIFASTQQFQTEETIPSAVSVSPAYTNLQAENIWGRAIERMVADGWSAEEATEEAFDRIREIFGEWNR
ncbi:MAG: ABC transporter substrate-binding protein [Cyanobacteria bacterium P01_E01_bin.42]